jgi:hypothetical protein
MKRFMKLLSIFAVVLLFAGLVFAADQTIKATEEMVGAGHATKTDTLNRMGLVGHNTDGTHKTATAAEALAGASTTQVVVPSVMNAELVKNLKPVVNASVNKLDIFTKSGGAAPDASNVIAVAIPDGTGYTFRTRAAAYLSGTSQFIMDDAANYWGAGSLTNENKTAWLYAAWDGTGIVWMLRRFSGFAKVSETSTATDDDFCLLEYGSTYTKHDGDPCVAVAKIRYQYDTSENPDHEIQATVLDAPRVSWNPKSDYARIVSLAATNTSAADIDAYSAVSVVVKQSGRYFIVGNGAQYNYGTSNNGSTFIRTGSATYGSAVLQGSNASTFETAYSKYSQSVQAIVYLDAGDTIHLGLAANSTGAGNRNVLAGSNLSCMRID